MEVVCTYILIGFASLLGTILISQTSAGPNNGSEVRKEVGMQRPAGGEPNRCNLVKSGWQR